MNQECNICFGNEWITKTNCNHIFCINCLFKLEKDECPLCRKVVFDNFPKELKPYLTINNKSKKVKSNYNILNNDDFPPLSR